MGQAQWMSIGIIPYTKWECIAAFDGWRRHPRKPSAPWGVYYSLLHGILERATRAEARGLCCWNGDLRASLRVDTLACLALTHLKAAKASQRHLLAAGEGLADDIERGIDHLGAGFDAICYAASSAYSIMPIMSAERILRLKRGTYRLFGY